MISKKCVIEMPFKKAGSPGSTDRRREDNPSSIDSLPDTPKVHPSCHLLDEHGREPLSAELLVHAKEVDLGRRERSGCQLCLGT